MEFIRSHITEIKQALSNMGSACLISPHSREGLQSFQRTGIVLRQE